MKKITEPVVKEKKLALSAQEQYKKALEAAEAIKQAAVDELMKNITWQIDELNGFGFNFKLVKGDGTPSKKAASTRKRAEICSICNFATNPPHDGRLKFHRDQETKKPLTEKQLADNGLARA